MPITAFPIATVPPAANLISNIPFGSVTATDVQTAINQLASLIPIIGSGTDPLFLINGLSIDTFNPTISGDPNDRWATRIRVATDCAQNNPNFSNNECLEIDFSALNGQATNGGITTAKVTFLALNMGATYNASGQKNLTGESVTAYGMSDTSIGQQFVQYAGGPVNGDEGQGFRLVSPLQQQGFLNTTTIQSKPTQSVVNTTTTQAIVASKNAQTVTVVSTAGAVNGDWVVIEQQVASGSPNLEAVQIISFTPTSITGIFRYNHNNGVTVTPALVIQCFSTFQMGQDRVLVNLSAPSYSTGTVTAISGGGMDFSGTALNSPTGPVGGTALNIGAISLTADDCTAGPFGGGNTLKSWYQITSVTTATHLTIHTFSVAGDAAYHGRGPGPAGSGAGGSAAYIIRPCARVLRFGGTNGVVDGFLICETSNAALWVVGNSVEQAICPYADVTGFNYRINHYTPGGAGVRSFLGVENWGARMWDTGILLRAGNGGIGQPTGDTVAMNTGIFLDNCNTGLVIFRCNTAGISLTSNFGSGAPDVSGWISYNPANALNGCGIGPYSPNVGLRINGGLGQASANGRIDFIAPGITGNPDAATTCLAYYGNISLPVVNASGAQRGYILFDWLTDPINFERGFTRWDVPSQTFEIGTEKGGAGGTHDMVLKTNNTEVVRMLTAGNVKFSNAANFSANGGVATVLGSIGPAGASTTVQTWLTIKDSGGNTRYIPCF